MGQIDTGDPGGTASGYVQVAVANAKCFIGSTFEMLKGEGDQIRRGFQFAVVSAEGDVEREIVSGKDVAHSRAVVVGDEGGLQSTCPDFSVELGESLIQGNVFSAIHFCFQQDGFGALPLVSR